MKNFLALLIAISSTSLLAAQETMLSLYAIFNQKAFEEAPTDNKRWVDEGEGYTKLESNTDYPDLLDIVRYETASGARTVLVSATALLPTDADQPLEIEAYEWSPNKEKLLIYTNSKRVWRDNTRGDYWIKDLSTGALNQLGVSLPESSLMFAKFSPDGTKVAYVSENNLYVESLSDFTIRPLTTSGSETIINGTFDWVYEEELDCQDGFRWSPDSKQVAFWQLDASGIRDFLLINNTDSVYSFTKAIQYPKVGTINSAARIGVINLETNKTMWMDIVNDLRNNYLARMEWAANSNELVVQQLNRKQNTNNVFLCDAQTGKARKIHTDQDEAWVEVVDDLLFFNQGKNLTWVSEKNGWKSVYQLSRDGKEEKLITPGTFDVINIELIDTKGGWIYYLASPDNATQQYLYRNRMNKPGSYERLSPKNLQGTHSYDISPNGKWAIHTYEKSGVPPVISLVSLPGHQVITPIEDNSELRERLDKINLVPQEFFQITTDEGVTMDGWMIKPENMDPDKKYPLLVFVYGEPANVTVEDKWGGSKFFYHQLLAKADYVVVSMDNRGTPAPKGRQWRKSVYVKHGIISSRDQSKGVTELLKKHPFLDPNRVGVWGWSGGGANTLNGMFRYPDLYKTGVCVSPVTDIRLYDNIYQERYCGLLSERKQEYYESSPVNFAKNLRGNLLLIHGTGDDNVHYQNTELLINELIRQDKQFSMMSYPNRTHGISEGANTSKHVYQTMFEYIKKNL